MQKIKKLVPIGLTFMPFIAGADTDVFQVINTLNQVLKAVIPFLIGIAVIIFLIGVIKYITAGDDPEKVTAGRNMMIYGIIGLFVMVSVWGLVFILQGTFDLRGDAPTGDIDNLLPF